MLLPVLSYTILNSATNTNKTDGFKPSDKAVETVFFSTYVGSLTPYNSRKVKTSNSPSYVLVALPTPERLSILMQQNVRNHYDNSNNTIRGYRSNDSRCQWPAMANKQRYIIRTWLSGQAACKCFIQCTQSRVQWRHNLRHENRDGAWHTKHSTLQSSWRSLVSHVCQNQTRGRISQVGVGCIGWPNQSATGGASAFAHCRTRSRARFYFGHGIQTGIAARVAVPALWRNGGVGWQTLSSEYQAAPHAAHASARSDTGGASGADVFGARRAGNENIMGDAKPLAMMPVVWHG